MGSFFSELKRRNVIRVGIAYVIVAWLLAQAGEMATDIFEAPPWVAKIFVVFLFLGFPLALFFAWAFELTPEGLRKEKDVDRSTSITAQTGRKLDYTIIAVLALAVGLLLFDKYVWEKPEFDSVSEVDARQSIAVLPFANISADPEQEYFVSGMHDALIAELARISELSVISRTSVMRYENTMLSMPEIGRELGVGAIVEGSVFRSGDQVRITAQLIDATTDEHLWAETFDRDLSDVLDMHKEVTRGIAQQIQVTLTTKEQDHLASTRQVNPEAHRLYLQGRYLMDQPVREPIEKSIELFGAALELDPEFALAHIGKADAYLQLNFFGFESQSTIAPKARAAAEAALRSDPTLGEAYVALASLSWMNLDWAATESHYRRALELSPSNASAHIDYALYLAALRRFDEALELERRVQELDPFDVIHNVDRGSVFYYARRYKDAISVFDEVLEMRPTATYANLNKGLTYLHLGEPQAALEEFNKCVSCPWAVGLAYAALGRVDDAKTVIDSYLDRMKTEFVWVAVIALQYAAIGDLDEAFRWLEKAYEDKESWIGYLLVEPLFDPLRDDPRFDDLVARMNYPETP